MSTSRREQGHQNIAWFRDHHTRGLLDLDPPYQRRSVWTPRYREDFIDTVLLNYPAPAIFLYETIDDDGRASYSVVDGKQRLKTVFEFLDGEFPVGNSSTLEKYAGMYFESLPVDVRKDFMRYRFSIEILPTVNESELNLMFDRLNRNVKKLTHQELRHARFDGEFISVVEKLSRWLPKQLGEQFPRIPEMSRRQMKDDEIVATLLLYIEEGAKSHSSAALDDAFAGRDDSWDGSQEAEDEFRAAVRHLRLILDSGDGQYISNSRLRNQADFYSLFAAVVDLMRDDALPTPEIAGLRLRSFVERLDALTEPSKREAEYLEAARSASNDAGPRKTRIKTITDVLLGTDLGNGE